jgi:cytochrome b
MGVQGIIWNCRSWGSGSMGMERYSACFDRRGKRKRRLDEALAHRNHVHLGLNRAGARMQTGFWRR